MPFAAVRDHPSRATRARRAAAGRARPADDPRGHRRQGLGPAPPADPRRSRGRSTRTPPRPRRAAVEHVDPLDHAARYLAGLDAERARLDIKTMALEAHEPLWSMGDDTPTAGRGRLDRPVADHLRQAFAQVTNPAIDPERERVVMDLRVELGSPPGAARRPAARTADAPPGAADRRRPARAARRPCASAARRVRTLDATWPAAARRDGLAAALEALAPRRRRGRGVGRRGPHRQRRGAVGRAPAGPVDPGRGRRPHRADRRRPARSDRHRRRRRRHPRRPRDGDGPRGRRHGRPSAARPGAGRRAGRDARRRGRSPRPPPSATSSPPSRPACARPSPGWASARSRATSAGRSSTPSTSRPTSSPAASRTPPRGPAGRPSPTSASERSRRRAAAVGPAADPRRPRAAPAGPGLGALPGRRRGPPLLAGHRQGDPGPVRLDRRRGRGRRRSMPRSLRYRTALARGADAPAVPRDELRVRRVDGADRRSTTSRTRGRSPAASSCRR